MLKSMKFLTKILVHAELCALLPNSVGRTSTSRHIGNNPSHNISIDIECKSSVTFDEVVDG